VVEGRHEDWFDESDVRSQVSVTPSIPLQGEKQPPSSLADDPLTRLWQGAEKRASGAEAVAAIRAARQPEAVARKKGVWRRVLRRDNPHEPPASPQRAP
jgi:hypothetical protein